MGQKLQLCLAWLAISTAIAGCSQSQSSQSESAAKSDVAANSAPAETTVKVYDEQANAQELIDKAVRSAASGEKRALIVFGGNWCGWCIKLHKLFQDDAPIHELLTNEYVVTWVDSAQLKQDPQLNEQYAAEIGKHGVPFLAVYAGDGSLLTMQDTGSLEDGPLHDPAKVLVFLREWAAPQVATADAVSAAQTKAKAEDKKLFVELTTPTCGWCRRFEAFWTAHADQLERDFVPVKVDLVRHAGGNDFAEKIGYKPGEGVPWLAVLDADGKVLATSAGPQGNIGHPAAPAEIEHFVGMLKQTATRNSATDIAGLASALSEAAKGYEFATLAPVAPAPAK